MVVNKGLIAERIRFACGDATLLVGRAAHYEFERAALHDVFMGNEKLVVRLAVELDFLHVTVLVAYLRSLDEEELAIGQGQLAGRNVRCTEHILVAARADGVEAHCREDVPC